MKKRETRYQIHVFISTREKPDGSKSCSQGNAKEIKDKLKEIALERKWMPRVRISESGCLGACGVGPNIMIYPQKIWLTNVLIDDIEDVVLEIENLLAN